MSKVMKQIAVQMVKCKALYDKGSEIDEYYGSVIELNQLINDSVPALKKAGVKVYSNSICGSPNQVSSFVLENRVLSKFGNEVFPDSETSFFCILVTEEKMEEVFDYLEPFGSFFEEEQSSPDVEGLANWEEAEKYLQKV